MSDLVEHLRSLHQRWLRLDAQMADPAIIGTPAYKQVLADHARIGRIMRPFVEWLKLDGDRQAAQELLSEPDLRAMAREEIAESEARQAALILDIQKMNGVCGP